MILQTLKILSNELENFLDSFVEDAVDSKRVVIGNIAFHEGEKYRPNSVDITTDDKIVISVVRVQEESILKNNAHFTKNTPLATVDYHNPKVHVNLYILITCNSFLYENAMTYLSRVIRFFQSKNVFTELNTDPILSGINEMDRFENFRLLMELYSPSFEESNHLWGMMGGKQLPFVMYKLRALDLEFRTISSTGQRVEEIHVVDEASGETVIVTKEE
ncbi:MAG: DUF4255 domain-containing protein [Saprospiraceae bacterium]